jgi:hypothetical protein
MSSFIYSVGLNNVGSYQVSGRPFCATGSLNNTRDTITFPDVTKQIVVLNRDAGADIMEVYFHVDSLPANRYTVNAGEQQTFNVKCKQVYVSSSATPDYTLYASLTGIPAARMYDLTGSGITS